MNQTKKELLEQVEDLKNSLRIRKDTIEGLMSMRNDTSNLIREVGFAIKVIAWCASVITIGWVVIWVLSFA